MKYFLDTEFIEQKGSIQLISIGMKCEDGRKLHLLSNEYNFDDASTWVVDNVIKPLYQKENGAVTKNILTHTNFHKAVGISHKDIAIEIKKFVGFPDYKNGKPEFWAYFADYDWVVFCWLFGTMIELPNGFPMYCNDLKQLLNESGKNKIPDSNNQHNALDDAEWNERLYHYLKQK